MGHKKELRHRLRGIAGYLEDARLELKTIIDDIDAPTDVRDRCNRICGALEIDVEELERIKKTLKS